MRKLTLDETWEKCLAMWGWLAGQVRRRTPKSVHKLKQEWLAAQGISDKKISHNCFFCDWHVKHSQNIKTILVKGHCSGCPGYLIDKKFVCTHSNYDYEFHPIAFYNKLVKLNKIRLSQKKRKAKKQK